METANKFSQSLRELFHDVGYNIGQVETRLCYINRYHCVFRTGLLLTPTVVT